MIKQCVCVFVCVRTCVCVHTRARTEADAGDALSKFLHV